MSTSAPDPGRRSAAILAISVATVVWGMAGLFVKSASVSALWFSTYRLWTGVAIYAVVLAVTRRRLRLATVRACAIGGVLFAADQAFAYSAFKLTTVANANIIIALAPIVIAFAASRLFGERFGRREVLLAGISFAGVGLVALGASSSPAWSLTGDLLALCSMGCWAAYWLYSKRVRQQVSTLEYMSSVMLVGALVMTPVPFLVDRSLVLPSTQDWIWIVTAALFTGALAHTLVAWAHGHVEAWLGSLITQCMPVVAAIAAWIALDEPLTPLMALGGVIAVAATATLAGGTGVFRRFGSMIRGWRW
jgi:drug/metabolite transporter (DMT)-like permease